MYNWTHPCFRHQSGGLTSRSLLLQKKKKSPVVSMTTSAHVFSLTEVLAQLFQREPVG